MFRVFPVRAASPAMPLSHGNAIMEGLPWATLDQSIFLFLSKMKMVQRSAARRDLASSARRARSPSLVFSATIRLLNSRSSRSFLTLPLGLLFTMKYHGKFFSLFGVAFED